MLSQLIKVRNPKDLFKWIEENLEYNGVSKEFLYSPKEVIKQKKAHCWESSSLEFTILDELKLNPTILYLESENGEVTHTSVYYTVNNKYYWFEWAWYKHHGIHEYASEVNLIKDIISKFKKDNQLKLITKGRTVILENTKQIDYYNKMINWYRLDPNNPQDKRTYRNTVRVIIIKDDKILLGKKVLDNRPAVYAFPGGGVEKHDSMEETVIKECLEEVGVLVKNVRSLNLVHRYNVPDDFFFGERAKLFKGLDNNWYIAEFFQYDKTHHGVEGDDMPFTWVTLDQAEKLIIDGPKSEFNPGRLEAIEKVKQLFAKKVKSDSKTW